MAGLVRWVTKNRTALFLDGVEDPLRESIFIAHELGHTELDDGRGEHADEWADQATAVKSRLDKIERVSVEEANDFYGEEVQAWECARRRLDQLGFERWETFRSVRDASLASYHAAISQCCRGLPESRRSSRTTAAAVKEIVFPRPPFGPTMIATSLWPEQSPRAASSPPSHLRPSPRYANCVPVNRDERYFVVEDDMGERVELLNVRRFEGEPIIEQMSGRGDWVPTARERDRLAFETAAVLSEDSEYEFETREGRRLPIQILQARRGPSRVRRY